MPPLFNVIRTCVLATVCLFTIIVLGLAAHFLGVLESSELTNYVPLAIFTATATLFIMSALWIGSCARRPHPIFQTKYELTWLAGLGILWLCLGAYTATMDDVDVECFDDTGLEVDSLDGFSTATYHAQFHAIQALAILNALLLFGLFALLLFLALRRNRRDTRRPVWAIPATMVNWFDQGKGTPAKKTLSPSNHSPLPPPVTARFTIARRAAKDEGDDEVTKSKPKVEMKEKFVSAAPMLARAFNFSRDRDRSSDEESFGDRGRERDRQGERERERARDRELAQKRERERERDRERDRTQAYDRELERERARARERDRQRDHSRERERDLDREQRLDAQSRAPHRTATIPPRSATTAGNVVGKNWQPPQRTLTIPARGAPRAAATVARPDIRPPPAAQTRDTPSRSRTIPARNAPTTNRQPESTPISDAFRSNRDRDLPAPPPVRSTRDRDAPPATSSRTRTGAAAATSTTRPAPGRSGRY